MLIYLYTKEKLNKKGEICMLNEEICKLRDKLNKSIADGEDYGIIYNLSVELDELIAKHYRIMKNSKKKPAIAML